MGIGTMTKKVAKNEPAVSDPMCGKAVDPEKALQWKWEGRTYYFCSENCRQRFDQDPPGDAGF